MSKLGFSVHDEADDYGKPIRVGVFGRDWESEEQSDAIMAGVESGDLDHEGAMKQLEQLLEEDPENLEVYNALGTLYWQEELKDAASTLYATAYKRSASLIPSEFKGRILWLEHDNRPFLRIAYGHLLCLMHEGNARSAQALANKLLRWNPVDNLGVRFLLGDIKFIQGDYAGAMKQYLISVADEPIHWYQAALIAFRCDDFLTACTSLRRGIACNPYVAEGILGRTQFADHFYWHGTNLVGAERAVEYLERWPRAWSDEEADFVDWVFNHSTVLRERAEITEIREGLLEERDVDRRGALLNRQESFMSRLDDTLSKTLVSPVKNRWGEDINPWDRSAHHAPAAVRNRRSQ